MRKIVRTTVPAPASLTHAGKTGAKERDAARIYYAQGATAAYPFKAYKGTDVAVAIEQLFKKKCAYCESLVRHVTDVEIEHFRPKGRFNECAQHTGYWWLAGQWDNLLCSCTNCNQSRSHRMVEVGMSRDELLASKPQSSGKATAFPVRDPSKYAYKESDDIAAEDPLLVDPTSRDPVMHLTWISDKDWSLVGPRHHPAGPDLYGRTSIQVFGLNRQDLVEERTSHRLMLATAIGLIEDALENIAEDGNEKTRAKRMARVLGKFESLFSYCAEDKKYSAMVSAFLHAEHERLVQKFEHLLVSPLVEPSP